LEDTHHIIRLQDTGPLTAVLTATDIARGKNSFYRLQALEHDKGGDFALFRAWGRVGSNVGGHIVDTGFHSKQELVERFKELYYEKSGNEWGLPYMKKPGAMVPLRIDFGEQNTNASQMIESGSKSTLPKEVIDLMKMIFDIDEIKRVKTVLFFFSFLLFILFSPSTYLRYYRQI